MKKMLVLTLVLGIAGLASAGLSLVSNYDGHLLAASETVTIQIIASGLNAGTYGNYPYFAVVSNRNAGTIAGGIVGVGDLTMLDTDNLLPFFPDPIPSMSGIAGFVAKSSAGNLDGIVIDQIIFHCEGPGDAVVQLWVTGDFGQFDLADSITIHQIPEPITMVLLGLGGLFLRKR